MVKKSTTNSKKSTTNTKKSPIKKTSTTKTKKAPIKAKGGGSKNGKGGVRERILTSIARLGRLHDGMPPRDQVAILAGYPHADTPGYKKMVGILKKGGLLVHDKKTMQLTDEGKDWLENHGVDVTGDVAESNSDFHECIKEMLERPKLKQAFEYLDDGRPHERSELAEELGYPNDKTPGFKKMLSEVKKKAFVEYIGKDMVQLSDKAFPFGRPF